MRKLILLTFLFYLPLTALADQRADIHLVLNEVDFLIDTTVRLKEKHSDDDSKVLFNYAALISQLEVTRDRIAEYLNEDIKEIRRVAPAAVDESLMLSGDNK